MSAVDVVAAAALLAGASLGLLASIGLHTFPDVFARMHAATKPAALGVLLVAVGASLELATLTDVAKLALAVVVQFLTAPVGAHMVGRAAYSAGTELSDLTSVDELAPAGVVPFGTADGGPPG
ncbi:MAG: monovalent cation/H(+) antiporter subunit G [Actinomycetota bacterium]|nr:monovalent cation/H(+) antiporter subunit G [Actinomycetota bacterium]